MIYQRGTTQSYQNWADAVGDQSYTFNNLLPYFKKSVHFTPPSSARAANASAAYNPAAFDPAGGPLQVSYANLMGAQYCSSTIDPSNENRDSSQSSFLNKAQNRGNLKIYTISTAQKIIFDTNKVATGVSISSSGGPSYIINANKEVILSAGAFQSPQLLMLSGIGPAAQLSKFNIPVVKILEGVGKNMWDHVFFGPSYRVNVQTFTRLANDLAYVVAQYIGPYLIQKLGPLTNPVCDFLGWEKIPATFRTSFSELTNADLAQFPADWPEVEYLSAPGYVGNFASLPTTQPKDGYQAGFVFQIHPFLSSNILICSTLLY
jgi:choline dehydrogenase